MAGDKQRYTVAGSGIGRTGGSYNGSSPIQAAKKAANQLFKHTTQTKIKFIIREVKSEANADKKKFSYQAEKKNLRPHKVIKLGNGVEYTIKHKIDIKACKNKDDE